MLPRLKPSCFYDLVIEVAIVRPGPIQGDMVHPYLRRRQGEESVCYPNQAIREVLEKTLGVPLFQEQAMRLAVVAAGFTPGEADQLRRAMGAWRRTGVIQEFHQRLVDGMVSRGLSLTFAEQVFQQLKGFGEYGFPESHAASFALLVYVSAWLKFHYPAAFTAALLGSQPMGFYAPAQLVRDAQEHGVTVLPVCIQSSEWHACIDSSDGSLPALRLGLEQVHGLGQTSGYQIEEARRAGRFKSIYDLTKRCQLTQSQVLSLARAGALKSLSKCRRQAIWNSMERKPEPGSMPLFEGLSNDGFDKAESSFDDVADLPTTSPLEEVLSDYRASGLSLKNHPLHFIRSHLRHCGVLTAKGACSRPEGSRVMVVGVVLSRQRPATAKGLIFLTLEDETDIVNVVVPKAVWQRCDFKDRQASVLMVKGRVQRRGKVVHLLAKRLEAWSGGNENELSLADLPRMSRDFC